MVVLQHKSAEFLENEQTILQIFTEALQIIHEVLSFVKHKCFWEEQFIYCV